MRDGTLEPSDDAILAWARLVRVSQAVLAKVEADLKAAGFPPLSWYDALLELRRAGPGGLRPYQLQGHLLLAQYNLSRLTDRLIKAGYVERHDCADDARGQLLKISAAGRGLLRRMWPAYRTAIAAHFADRLEADEIAAFGRLLGKLG
jgi:DNA-binding MarR family transcriptional regulator